MQNKILIGVSAVAALLLIAVLGAALFLDANQFRPQLEGAIGGALGREVRIGNIKVALLSGGIVVEDVAIADDPAFGRAPFVTAKAVTIGVELMPLLFSKSLRVQTFRLEEPHVVLLSSRGGKWNFSGLGAASSGASATAGPASAMSILVRKISIDNGRITVGNRDQRGSERVYDNLDLDVAELSLTSRSPFRLTTKTPGGGTMTLDGQVGPFNTSDAALTPFHATLDVADFDVASSGFVDPASGLAGRVTFKGDISSDGERVASKGQAIATGFRLAPGGAPAKIPIQLDYETSYAPKRHAGAVTQAEVHIGKAVARLRGDYDTARSPLALRMKLSGDKMPASELQAVLPAAGVALPSGASLRDGTLDVDLTLTGPVDRLVIAGPLNLSNATLAGFDLGGRLGSLPSVGGLPQGGDTAIQTLAARIRLAPDGIQANEISLVAPAIGSLTGGGTISPKTDLDFRMIATLAGSASASQVSRIASFGRPASGIPFRVTGTTEKPVFVPDVGRALGDSAKSLANDPESAVEAARALRGFFGAKTR